MNKHTPAIKTLLLTLTAAAAFATTARAQTFTPIAIDTNSFNLDPVIENGAPQVLNDVVNVTADGGTNKTGQTWFERGYNTASPTFGIPVHGTLVTDST